jgi:RimJ/RimL family protein N-acetyltransferase
MNAPVKHNRPSAKVAIRRHHTADMLNEVINHPDVAPWVRGTITDDRLDFSNAMVPTNYLLMGEHGGVMFIQHQQGVYEAHTSVLPAGRGQWCVDMVNEALHYMFTKTNCMEILTRVPENNPAALGLVRSIHGQRLFRRDNGWFYDGKVVPADVWHLTVQRWMNNAPGLEAYGEWFHNKLEHEYKTKFKKEGISHDHDANHDRYVGAAVAMIIGGEVFKGVFMYNRWAVVSGFQTVEIIAANPVTIDMNESIIAIKDGDFWVVSCR